MIERGAAAKRSARAGVPARARRLYTRRGDAQGFNLLRRLGWAFGLFAFTLGVLWLERAGLRDGYDGELSFVDLVYFTFVTITTVGYGDIVPITERARLVDALLVTPARLAFIMLFVGTAYQLVLQRWVERFRMARLQARLQGHVVICGFGAVGQMAAREIVGRGTLASAIVVVDRGEDAMDTASRMGLVGLRGDATSADVLADAAIARARGVVVCAGSDSANALVSLAVRMQSQTRLVVAAEGLDMIDVLRHSGANAVVSPPALAGCVLADALESPPVAELLVDVLTAKGDVEWCQFEVPAQDVGADPRFLEGLVVLAVRRGGKLHWPWQPEARSLQEGDCLVAVRSRC